MKSLKLTASCTAVEWFLYFPLCQWLLSRGYLTDKHCLCITKNVYIKEGQTTTALATDRSCKVRPAQLRKLEGPTCQHKFTAGRKSVFHFDVEISLWYGRNSGTAITYSRSSFCNIFYNWESSRGPQEKLSRAACGLRTVCYVGLFKVIRSAVRITIYCNMTCDLTFIIVQFESESTHKFNPKRQKQTCLVYREKTENRYSFARMFRIPLYESLVLLWQRKNQKFHCVINILMVMHQFLKT